MSDQHTALITFDAGPEPSPRWRIVCPDGCACDLNDWIEAEGGWPMFDLHAEIEVYVPVRVWWDNGVQVDPLPTTGYQPVPRAPHD